MEGDEDAEAQRARRLSLFETQSSSLAVLADAIAVEIDESKKQRLRDTVDALTRMSVLTACDIRQMRSTVATQVDDANAIDSLSLGMLRHAAAYEWSAQDELSMMVRHPNID